MGVTVLGIQHNFYPRSPCGERRIIDIINNVIDNFYPRSPCGERRARRASRQQPAGISIHALLAESDRSADCNCRSARPISIHALLAESDCIIDIINNIIDDFYPRSPCGERPRKGQSSGAGIGISIHALLAESDPMTLELAWAIIVFLSTLSLRRATSAL